MRKIIFITYFLMVNTLVFMYSCTNKRNKPISFISMNQSSNFGSFDVSVNSLLSTNHFGNSYRGKYEYYAGKGNKYLVLGVTYTNVTNTPKPALNMKTDDACIAATLKGKQIFCYANMTYLAPDGFINPGVTQTFNLIFNVPEDIDQRICFLPFDSSKCFSLTVDDIQRAYEN